MIVTTDGKTYEVKTGKSSTVSTPVTGNTKPETQQESETTSEPSTVDNIAYCGSGQVNVNTAELVDISKIKHIYEKRGNELIKLRPFNSIDDLKRINGIGDARIKDIKAEGIACIE